MSEEQVVVKQAKKSSGIWLIPIIAALLGLFLVVQNYLSKGPEITLTLNTASGLEAGKTKIKYRSVVIGLLEELLLAEDNQSVKLKIQLDPAAKEMLREDTQFWVVRPRIGAGGVSGLSTLLSGAYIKLEPGNGLVTKQRRFTGLEEAPVTPIGTPGLRLTLTSNNSKSLSVGDPVTFRGFLVGQVETARVDPASRRINYDVFINAPYDRFVTSKTRFWNSGGINVNVDTDGLELQMESIFALLAGGVSFDLPDEVKPGFQVSDNEEFTLHPNKDSINQNPYRKHVPYIVNISESIRGLKAGAAVEFRGIKIGIVDHILLENLAATSPKGTPRPFPIKIHLTPAMFRLPDNQAGVEQMNTLIKEAVEHKKMRASLKTSSLLTGQQYIDLDIYPLAEEEVLGERLGLPVIPSVTGGFKDIQEQVTLLLQKVNALPLESLITSADGSLQQLEKTLAAADGAMASANSILASKKMQELPDQLDRTIQSYSADSRLYDTITNTTQELNTTLQSLHKLVQTLNKQPSSLLFPKKNKADLQPTSPSAGDQP